MLCWISRAARFCFCCALLAGVLYQDARGQEWTRFRGPNGTGASEAEGIPAVWKPADENWRVKLPGVGNGSPSIWGDKIFLQSGDPASASRIVLCLSAKDGKVLWNHSFPSKSSTLHSKNNYGSGTPAVNEKFVFVLFGSDDEVDAACLDHDGKVIWVKPMGSFTSDHGFATSPMLYEDLVVYNNHQMGDPSKLRGRPAGKSSMIALSQKTGEKVWELPRSSMHVCYSVPAVYTPSGGAAQLICCSFSHGMFAMDPKTGRELWTAENVFDKRTVSSPVLAGDVILGTTGEGSGDNTAVAIRPGAKPEVLWTMKKAAPYVPTPVCKGNLAFLWQDRGVVTCVDLHKGTQIWQERVGGNYFGSPIRVRDAVYCISEEGDVTAIAASDQYKLLGKTSLGEVSRATPAVSGGRMYLRSQTQLVSVGGKK